MAVRKAESVFARLDKILALERRKGLLDRAVVGGMEKFLSRWEAEAQAEAGPAHAEAIQALLNLFVGYSQKGAEDRLAAVDEAMERLAELRALGIGVVGKPDATTPPASPAGPGPALTPPAAPAPATVTSPAIETPSPRVVKPPTPPRPRGPHLDSPVSVLPRVGNSYSNLLGKLGVKTIRDLLYFFPRRYNDYSHMKRIKDLQVGAVETIVGTIWDIKATTTRTGKPLVRALLADESGTVEVTWWGQRYLADTLQTDRQLVISGEVELNLGRKCFVSPEWELLESEDLVHTGRLVPVYPLTEGLSGRALRKLIKSIVDRWASQLVDILPAGVRQRAGLADLPWAVAQMHFPDSQDALERARKRLAFDEFLLIQLGMLARRREWQEGEAAPVLPDDRRVAETFFTSLPFPLTAAQRRAVHEILSDMARPVAMSRLLQGEVGSGKTVVAATAMLVAVANGYQAALMAPTEILAEQHFKTLRRLFEPLAAAQGEERLPRISLLTGSVKNSERATTCAAIAAGQVDIVIGTHALIQEGVHFARLGFVIVDEQHRFGVMQRSALVQKGTASATPHLLVMTATPIPRTLALTIYGDLDISTLDELPPGRQPIQTRWLEPRERERAYSFIRKQVKEGRQAFIICPLVTESEVIAAKAATEEFERLQREIFPDLRLGLLHGRMKGQDKEATMLRFRDREIDILVSTAVVEVGIDVPNATVMLVEGADRFGLAQLHQFRGRVGRGEHASYCLLLADHPTAAGQQRLSVIETTQDGFKLAEEDLKLRGPGDFFGTRQAGLPDLKVATLADTKVLELARREAQAIFRDDPRLQAPEHRLLAEKVREFWSHAGEVS